MGKYKDHREPRRRRHDDGLVSFSDRAPEPSYFQRSPATHPIDAEVLWFNGSKGFGFVKLQDGSEVYIHARVLEAAGRRDICEGSWLKVTLEESPRGRQVSQVLESNDAIPKVSFDEADAKVEIEATVKWYNSEKGFGFIAPVGGERDVFVHATALNRSGVGMLADGQRVFIACAQGKKGSEVRSIRLA